MVNILLSLFLFSLSMHCFNACLTLETSSNQSTNQTFRSEEFHKPAVVKTIQDLPKRPIGHNQTDILSDNMQFWSSEGTHSIRRTKQDILRTKSISRFGRKLNQVGTNTGEHLYAIARVNGDKFYGAKATINVWRPYVENNSNNDEFSLSQIWVTAGSDGELNTIEAGWRADPKFNGDNLPRLFIFMTKDGYQTGCYNLGCGFVPNTNSVITLGAPISSTSSTYNGQQVEITLSIYKDQKSGNWQLEYESGNVIGYWPSSLFTHLNDGATDIDFGGEVSTTKKGSHTTTQMGSGHFPDEGYGKASYFRNIQVVDSDNKFIPLPNVKYQAEHPNCYNIIGGVSNQGQNFFYYGGPGKNVNCP
ncbi:putative neprosin [Medicago truncatula]|uniref:Carboxyl-terminal peptidase n=1 Tax=Medicago truncatula TaxID=3880 RepID=G7IKS5_MEDTR|nr:uncharacterized protein LOC11412796 [Medicago truncatula]AES67452.1 carboxyl-terminal peptidase [Medicago truncatula]RHN75916.1 putative neprosin [Medicago truncatula]